MLIDAIVVDRLAVTIEQRKQRVKTNSALCVDVNCALGSLRGLSAAVRSRIQQGRGASDSAERSTCSAT